MTALRAYPYLVIQILWLAGALLALRLAPPAVARLSWRMGLLGLVLAPSGLFFDGEYWAPVRAAGGVFGVEDVLAPFNFGAASGLSFLLLGRWVPIPCLVKLNWKRLVALAPAGPILFLLVWRAAGSSMTAGIAAQVALAAVVLCIRPEWWPVSLAGGLSFGLLYCLLFRVFLIVWPELIGYWRPVVPWGVPVFGIPFGEIAWSITYGMVWPALASFVFEDRCEVAAL